MTQAIKSSSWTCPECRNYDTDRIGVTAEVAGGQKQQLVCLCCGATALVYQPQYTLKSAKLTGPFETT